VSGDTLNANLIDHHGTIRDNFTILKNTTIGVDEINDHSAVLNLFPNPANSLLNIKYVQNNRSGIDIKIIDPLGKVVESIHDSGNAIFTQVDIRHIPAGVYMVVVYGDASMTKSLFVKE
jgi:hypothetical protein